MTVALVAGAVVLILLVLVDAFETVVLPRRVDRAFRIATLYYRVAWHVVTLAIRRVKVGYVREAMIDGFGPASLLLLLMIWAASLIVGFATIQWAIAPNVEANDRAGEALDFSTALYMSGSTFFTLGYGDVTPISPLSRALSVAESGLGFAFLALVIGYLPALIGPFSRRELTVFLLDARAGSPPSAAEVLRRHAGPAARERLVDLLAEWERWAAGLLESHLSYPILAFFRSQHARRSWVATLAVVLDTSAILICTEADTPLAVQARLTFATARHAAADLSQIFRDRAPRAPSIDERLRRDEHDALWEEIQATIAPDWRFDRAVRSDELSRAIALYEDSIHVLSRYLLMPLPRLLSERPPGDDWYLRP